MELPDRIWVYCNGGEHGDWGVTDDPENAKFGDIEYIQFPRFYELLNEIEVNRSRHYEDCLELLRKAEKRRSEALRIMAFAGALIITAGIIFALDIMIGGT
ncbi:hypothetical protein [Phaeobacter gallaeciensis]|uniref:Uncharacterized protein n=1 Tax=Phaeobacter gallaeciensis TaxID=60890 RepID=A0AAC9Z9Z0_9RHOB|nr:hypothetical protein [Phaeobacter gallaeciensis]AHD10046.1 hypothetical protein Gal_02299 [Phaeobacter gallaeciensis DSM 26640]ATE93310.1 hypothetical protein PhaeoP11_02290 [Phaeobacter gallaeciensis]ATE96869.1 hypothetical protein PhaeoP73_01557 [Phaeobacter gallaeciensis]ATF01974.1 hypothetical protein PhaeoP75_02339 [Phaeobacter gallaeciensis]ATF06354.1 hypothetical protein PhaeoP63_02288 [Phaeobacter gallaeciensis]